MVNINKKIIKKIEKLYGEDVIFDNYVSIVKEKDEMKISATSEKLYSMIKWFEMFSGALDKFDLKKYKKSEINEQTIELVNYISCCNGIVDMYEGLKIIVKETLNIQEEYNISGYFSKTREVNKKHDESYKMEKKEDIQYFKHIRAVFGQHPANIVYEFDGKKIRAFASWTFKGNHFCGGDFEDTKISKDMYVNICDNAGINTGFGVKFFIIIDEIEEFIDGIRKGIVHWVDAIERDKKEKLAKKKLKFDNWEKMDRIDKIDAIIRVCEKEFYLDPIHRQGGEKHYLCGFCDELKEMLNFEKLVNYESESIKYVQEIENIIEEIKEKVEDFSFEEIKSYHIFKDKLFRVIGNSYYAEKCSAYLRLGELKNESLYQEVVDELMLKLSVERPNNFHYLSYLLHYKGEKVFDKDPFLKD